jgi:hypothetical protein
MNVLARVIQAAWEEANKPETYVWGEDFERYIREKIFPKELYAVLRKTHGYTENRHDFIASSKEPDFRFRVKNSNFEFYVEAKYRSKFHEGGLECCKNYQLKRYQEINNTTPVLIAMGLGGRPAAPDKVFLIPLTHVKFVKLFPSFLDRYEISPDHSITPNILKNIF